VSSSTKAATTSLVLLSVLATIAALYLLRPILIPIALALLLACLFSPVTTFLRRLLRLSPIGAAVTLFFLAALLGLYLASLTFESVIQAANTLASDVKDLAGVTSRWVDDVYREHPLLRSVLPNSKTINLLGDMNALLVQGLRSSADSVTYVFIQSFIILILVLFLLAEGEMLAPKAVRFFAQTVGDQKSSERTFKTITSKIREFLLARTLINLGLGAALALVLWLMGVRYALVLGLCAAVTNYIPYVGQVVGGAIPVVLTLGQTGSLGNAIIVAAIFLALVGLEGYVVTPFVMGKSLDLNGTTVLIACLFWGFLWGLVGLILAMPITASIKLVFEEIPSLKSWADLMSNDNKLAAGSTSARDPLAEDLHQPSKESAA
jgi:AI-2 transport protein TqsA